MDNYFKSKWIALVCALALLPALTSHAAVDDPRTRKVITEGLDYLAYNSTSSAIGRPKAAIPRP